MPSDASNFSGKSFRFSVTMKFEAKTFPRHLLPDPDAAHVIATAMT